MPSINIVKKTKHTKSFKTQSIKSKFDITDSESVDEFVLDFEYPETWNIGVIYGASGTGKTTIAKELFDFDENYTYGDAPIVEEMGDHTLDEITMTLNSVGFSSPTSWLKQYSVLSNGQKMRTDLARALLENKAPIVFDEFTSVVDRQVAQVCSHAVAKKIRKENKQFVAVTCHKDILEWLEPDWVICTDDMSFQTGTVVPNTKDHPLKSAITNVQPLYGKSLKNIII